MAPNLATTTKPVGSTSQIDQLVHATPIIETSAATNRLNTIIHQSETKPSSNFSTKTSSTIELRSNERKYSEDPISSSHDEVITITQQDDYQHSRTRSLTRSASSSSTSSSSGSALSISPSNEKPAPATPINIITTTVNPTANPRQRNVHGSYESLPQNYGRNEGLRANAKTASLDFGMKPVQYDDAGKMFFLSRLVLCFEQ